MSRLHAVRTAWAASIGAGLSAIAYLSLMPMTGSRLADYAVTVLIIASGAVVGGTLQVRLENFP